jgi:hypothetical protein
MLLLERMHQLEVDLENAHASSADDAQKIVDLNAQIQTRQERKFSRHNAPGREVHENSLEGLITFLMLLLELRLSVLEDSREHGRQEIDDRMHQLEVDLENAHASSADDAQA